MTNEEAIKIFSAWAKCNYKPTREAAEIAIAALHAQQTKLDRSRWKGCYWCTGFCPEVTGDPHWDYRFCPKCGRPLTEEALAELERRIGGNDGTID